MHSHSFRHSGIYYYVMLYCCLSTGSERQSLWQQCQRQRKWPLDCLWFPPFQIVVAAAAAAVFLPSSLFLGKHLPPIMTGRDKESETVDNDNKLDNSMISCSSCIFICRLCRLWLKLELTFAFSMSDGFTLIRRYFLHCITLFWAKRLRLMSVYVHI